MYSQVDLQNRLISSLRIIKEFEWLLDSYVLDFFVQDHWNKLPSSWRETFQNVDPPEIGDLLLGSKPKRVYPLSFLALLFNIKMLSLSRKPIVPKVDSKTTDLNDFSKLDEFKKNLNCKDTAYNNLFLKHVKEKKRHEISLMSNLIYKTIKDVDCQAVVDIGSGLGHLVRTLSYKYRLKTVGIEAQNELVNGARKLDDQFDVTLLKYTNKSEIIKGLRPQHINVVLNSEVKSETLSQLNNLFGGNFGLIGLHPCGDLGPLLMKMFIESEEIKFICIVGCCYMKLTCKDADNLGYPLSAFVSSMKTKTLSYESRELACHALETYCKRLKKGMYEDLQIHCFRALLEKILVSKWPHLKHSGLKSVKHYDTLSFEKYCNIAMEKLSIKLNTDEVKYDINKHLNRWKEVVIFYTLRLCIAPLIESVILMDRILYLRESGIGCEIIPLFDPFTSPRNHVLIAKKI